MKPLPPDQKTRVRRKLAASAKERARIKAEMINAARAKESGDWPEYLLADLTDDAWFHRRSAVADLIGKRGRFSHHVVMLTLTDSEWETKEWVAGWLRTELARLREAEKKAGGAPVRRGKTMSRTEIADIAIELLECIGGESLICLFQELLEVDRHRRALAENFMQIDRAAEIEATTALQGELLGVRSLAKMLSVSASTVTRWRRAPSFEQRVQFNKQVWEAFLRDEYFEEIRKEFPNATGEECFRHAFRMYAESLPMRRA